MNSSEEGCGESSESVILATGGYDHTIRLWQAHTGNCQRTLQNPESQVNALEITPDRQRIAAAGFQHVRLYDINSPTNTAAVNCEGLTKNVTSVGFQEDGKWMYTGGEDCSARIWDLRKGSMQCQRIFQVSAPVNCVCLHPNQAELIVGDQSGIIHIWDLKTDHNEQLIPETDAAILSMAVDSAGTFLAAVNNKGRCFIWGLGGGTNDEPTRLNPKHKLEAHKRHALKCRFSPDSQMLVTTSADQTAKIWETDKFEMVQELTCDAQRWVWDAAFSLDSQYVVTASSDGVARLWDVADGSIQREYTGHQKAITALALEDVAKD